MKKIIVFAGLIATGSIMFTCTGQNVNSKGSKIKNDLSELKLKGMVKSLTETNFNDVDELGEIQKTDFESKVITLFNGYSV